MGPAKDLPECPRVELKEIYLLDLEPRKRQLYRLPDGGPADRPWLRDPLCEHLNLPVPVLRHQLSGNDLSAAVVVGHVDSGRTGGDVPYIVCPGPAA